MIIKLIKTCRTGFTLHLNRDEPRLPVGMSPFTYEIIKILVHASAISKNGGNKGMRTRKFGHLLLALLLAGMAIVVGVNAAPDTTGTANSFQIPAELKGIVTTPDPNTIVISGNGENKQAIIDKLSTVKQSKAVTTATTSTLSGHNEASRQVLGSSIRSISDISGYNDPFWVIPYNKYASGSQKAYWYGTNPYNANRITLNSRITATGIGASLSFMGVSGGFTPTSGNSASYTGVWNNVWNVQHSYSNFRATSWAGMPGISQSDSSTFRFGTSDYTLFTYVNI